MNKENTERLLNDFPLLYSDKDAPLIKSLMAFGFECGDGWFDLIYDLSKKIENKNIQFFADGDEEHLVKAVQIKEKFGGLRFYTNFYFEDVEEWIKEAEDKSERTCENCGKLGSIKSKHGWLLCRCEEC